MLADRGPSPSAPMQQRERAVALADQLARLPPQYRDVIVLRNLQGLSFEEVADRMDRKPGDRPHAVAAGDREVQADLSTDRLRGRENGERIPGPEHRARRGLAIDAGAEDRLTDLLDGYLSQLEQGLPPPRKT